MDTINNELERQTNYIIAVHDKSDKFAVENSIEEAELYVKQWPTRKAVVVSGSYRNDELNKIAYNQVQTFRKGEIRLVDNKGNPDVDNVVDTVGQFLKNGLIVINDLMLGGYTIKNMLARKAKGQDIIIHRNILAMHEFEIDFINTEIEKCNEAIKQGLSYKLEKIVYFRIHLQDEFKFSQKYLTDLMKVYGQEIGWLIFLAQFILQKKRMEYRKVLEMECQKNEQVFEDFIDPYWFRRNTSNFVYLNLMNKQIAGDDPEFLKQCQEEIANYFKNQAGDASN